MKNLIAKIENAEIDFPFFVLTFFGVVVIRGIIESFSSPGVGGHFLDWTAIFVHLPLWFAALFAALTIILHIFTGEGVVKIAKAQLFFFPIIWLPIIIDFVASQNGGHPLSYLFPASFIDWLKQTAGFFFDNQMSIGIRIEITLVLAATASYVYAKTKKIKSAVLAIPVVYLTIAFFGSLPGFIFMIQKSAADSFLGATAFYEKTLTESNVIVGRGYFPPVSQFSLEKINASFDLFLSAVLFIIFFLIAVLQFFLWSKEKFFAFVKNTRPERLLHYCLMGAMGMGVAYLSFGQFPSLAVFNIAALMVFFLTIAASWLFVLNFNDVIDIESDRVSNPNRPLPMGKLSVGESRSVGFILLLFSLWGAAILGYYTLLFIAGAHIIAFLYSSPPLKLKNFPVINPFAIAAASLFFMMAGFFLIAPTLKLDEFPKEIILLMLVCFTLGANFKDIKDIEGDRLAGVKTIPVIFSEKRGKLIIGALTFLSLALGPIFLRQPKLVPLSVFLGILAGWAVNKKKYDEKMIFLIYFVYVFAFIVFFAYN